MVLAPSKGEKDAQWITCQVKSGESLNESNFLALTTVCCLFEGPDAWAKARPIGDLPEKPWHMYGEAHCLDHSIREETNFPAAGSYVTCWYTTTTRFMFTRTGADFRAFGGPSQPTTCTWRQCGTLWNRVCPVDHPIRDDWVDG